MIVYRCVSERELACMIGISNYVNAPHGKNTFNYEKNIQYKHFFIIMIQQFHLWMHRILIDIMISTQQSWLMI